MDLQGKKVLLGVTGSIAAYKAADICSRLGKLNADVHVILTENAEQFVGIPTFRALTRNPVLTHVFDEPNAQRIVHIDLAQSADLVLIAPASADILAKMAHGIADDMLTTCLLATPQATPVLVAPAMNTEMWNHPATRANMALLKSRGIHRVEPGYGLLACQDIGYGKLADVAEIERAVLDRLTRTQDLEGRRILITAGATREPLDPVRFLSNHSSGKMGYAIAEEAFARGAHVTLVSGFATIPPPHGVELMRVESAEDMLQACLSHSDECDLIIGAAAVADFAPEVVAPQKWKKSEDPLGSEEIVLRLRRTPDIIAKLAERRKKGSVVVGFAAETENLLAHARRKLHAKRLDLIIANDVTAEGAGFDSDTNIVTFLWPDGTVTALPQMPKRDVARHLIDALIPQLSRSRQ